MGDKISFRKSVLLNQVLKTFGCLVTSRAKKRWWPAPDAVVQLVAPVMNAHPISLAKRECSSVSLRCGPFLQCSISRGLFADDLYSSADARMEMVVTRGSNPCIFPTLRLVEEVTAVQKC